MKKIATIPLARPAIASLCLSLCLAACGGDGDNPQSAGSPSGGISSGVSGGVSSGYSISGVVSGLASGFSLQLLNNGAAPLTLTANGAFTFAAPVALNSAYAVTIGTQPLGQTCSVSSGSGVATAAVTNVTISCGAVQARVSTLAGSTTAGSADGTGTAASFKSPFGVALDASGNLYVADTGNSEIRMITRAGVVTTLAGSGATGFVDATGTAAAFNSPYAVAVDSSGNVYVKDNSNNVIRKVTAAGVVTTLADSSTTGSANGYGTAATFWAVDGIAVDTKGTVYVADANNNQIRLIQPAQ
jgi:hypothetical protein